MGWPTLSIKGQIVYLLSFANYMFSVKIYSALGWVIKASMDDTETNGCNHVPVKLSVQKTKGGTLVCGLKSADSWFSSRTLMYTLMRAEKQ